MILLKNYYDTSNLEEDENISVDHLVISILTIIIFWVMNYIIPLSVYIVKKILGKDLYLSNVVLIKYIVLVGYFFIFSALLLRYANDLNGKIASLDFIWICLTCIGLD